MKYEEEFHICYNDNQITINGVVFSDEYLIGTDVTSFILGRIMNHPKMINSKKQEVHKAIWNCIKNISKPDFPYKHIMIYPCGTEQFPVFADFKRE